VHRKGPGFFHPGREQQVGLAQPRATIRLPQALPPRPLHGGKARQIVVGAGENRALEHLGEMKIGEGRYQEGKQCGDIQRFQGSKQSAPVRSDIGNGKLLERLFVNIETRPFSHQHHDVAVSRRPSGAVRIPEGIAPDDLPDLPGESIRLHCELVIGRFNPLLLQRIAKDGGCFDFLSCRIE